jgi:hypothetical protein
MYLIDEAMSVNRKLQFVYESDTWSRLLLFLLDENNLLKSRLAEILNNGCNDQGIEVMEVFQTGFLKIDNMIGFLRNELYELNIMLVNCSVDNNKLLKEIPDKSLQIRHNVSVTEAAFIQLRIKFLLYNSQSI